MDFWKKNIKREVMLNIRLTSASSPEDTRWDCCRKCSWSPWRPPPGSWPGARCWSWQPQQPRLGLHWCCDWWIVRILAGFWHCWPMRGRHYYLVTPSTRSLVTSSLNAALGPPRPPTPAKGVKGTHGLKPLMVTGGGWSLSTWRSGTTSLYTRWLWWWNVHVLVSKTVE